MEAWHKKVSSFHWLRPMVKQQMVSVQILNKMTKIQVYMSKMIEIHTFVI